jgi:hypothetical protein
MNSQKALVKSRNKAIKAGDHFSLPILRKIAGNVKNDKSRIPFFVFLFKVKDNKDICNIIFCVFSVVHVYRFVEAE